MDVKLAIPSLCASTALCGAAAAGYTFGRRPSRGEHATPDSSAPITPSSSVTSFTSRIRRRTVRRPQSTVLPSDARRDASPSPRQYPTGEGAWRPLVPSQRQDDDLEGRSVDTGYTGAGTLRLSLLRRLSTILPSSSRNSISNSNSNSNSDSNSLSRPSIRSLFPDGSDTGDAPPATSSLGLRHRLLTRSTSQKALHAYSPDNSISSRPHFFTFRRSSKSRQQSTRLQLQTSPPQADGNAFPPVVQAAIRGPRERTGRRDRLHWRPFFRSQTVRISHESQTPSKSQPLSPTGRNDHLRCVCPSGDLPTLVMASSMDNAVAATPGDQAPSVTAVPQSLTSDLTGSISASLLSIPHGAAAMAGPKTGLKHRASFSFDDARSLPPSMTWKKPTRHTSLKGRKSVETATTRRVLSDIGPRSCRRSSSASPSAQQAIPSSASDAEQNRAQLEARGSNQSTPSRHLNHVRALGPSSYEDLRPDSSTPVSPAFSSRSQISSSSADLLHATSRHSSAQGLPPSDHTSPSLGSDTEDSRVFSANGDDTDAFSESIYDSVRTEATGSSHSGVRSTRIEFVFGDPNNPELLHTRNLTALQEKLSDVSLSSSNKQGDTETEKDGSIPTPKTIRQAHGEEPTTPVPNGRSARFTNSSPSPLGDGLHIHGHEADDYAFNETDVGEEDWSINERSWTWDHNTLGPINGRSPHTPAQRSSALSIAQENEHPKSDMSDWSGPRSVERGSRDGDLPRPKTVHGKQLIERGSRVPGRRGFSSSMHARSQSVPLPPDNGNQRFNTTAKLDAWVLGGKGVSEDWDNDFDFEELAMPRAPSSFQGSRAEKTGSSAVVVPRSILDKQASVHGQFGQVKELTLLVEELRQLRQSASALGIVHGQSSELWKEAEGIINLATVDEEDQNTHSSSSPTSTSFDFDAFDDDSAAGQRRPTNGVAREGTPSRGDFTPRIQSAARSSPASSRFETPPRRARKDSVAQAKHVLEHIHQHRSSFDSPLADAKIIPRKLPFDTTSLRDLVIRAGVVTRALKEIVRRAEDPNYIPRTPEQRTANPPDPPFSQIFQNPPSPSLMKRSPRMYRNNGSGNMVAVSVAGKDNEMSGHMKMLTVV